MHKTAKQEDGSVKFMCPSCNTWAKVSPEQYRGAAELICPHPMCDWSGTINFAAEAEAERAAAAAKAPTTADHF